MTEPASEFARDHSLAVVARFRAARASKRFPFETELAVTVLAAQEPGDIVGVKVPAAARPVEADVLLTVRL